MIKEEMNRNETINAQEVKVQAVGADAKKSLMSKAMRIKKTLTVFSMCCLMVALLGVPVYADAASVIQRGFGNLQEIISALVSAIGTIFLLWGVFEFGITSQSHDGVQQASAFKRMGGGLIMVLAPQLLPLLLP